MAGLEFTDIHKTFHVEDRVIPVFTGLCLQVPPERITVILGKSGCGKTTLLRLAGGLEQADRGEIRFSDSSRTAFVFQEPRLMPWLDVTGNVAFGLKKKERDPAEIGKIIGSVGLAGFEKAYPHQLSGGMQQRAALARALAYRPSFILMDEPFAALDLFTRQQMQRELLRVQAAWHAGILFVTHSIDEALLLGDKLAVIEKGVIKREFTLEEPAGERNLMDETWIVRKREVLACLGEEF